MHARPSAIPHSPVKGSNATPRLLGEQSRWPTVVSLGSRNRGGQVGLVSGGQVSVDLGFAFVRWWRSTVPSGRVDAVIAATRAGVWIPRGRRTEGHQRVDCV